MIIGDENRRDIDLRDLDDDRKPEPPDEHQEPLDLAEIDQRVDRLRFLGPFRGLVATSVTLSSTEDLADLRELLGHDVPHLLSRLRAAETELANLRAMPIETYRYVVAGDRDPDEHPLTEEIGAEQAIAESMSWPDSRPLRRAVYLGPWEDLRAYDVEAPF